MIDIEVRTYNIEGQFQTNTEGIKPITSNGLRDLSKSIRDDILENEVFRSESLRLAAASIMK